MIRRTASLLFGCAAVLPLGYVSRRTACINSLLRVYSVWQ